MNPVNVSAKFEVRRLTCSWDKWCSLGRGCGP